MRKEGNNQKRKIRIDITFLIVILVFLSIPSFVYAAQNKFIENCLEPGDDDGDEMADCADPECQYQY